MGVAPPRPGRCLKRVRNREVLRRVSHLCTPRASAWARPRRRTPHLGQSVGPLQQAAAQTGDSAIDPIPVLANGRFGGTVAPQKSTWFRFAYLGGGQEATIAITLLPADSPRTDLVVYTGSPPAPRQENSTADPANNGLTQI